MIIPYTYAYGIRTVRNVEISPKEIQFIYKCDLYTPKGIVMRDDDVREMNFLDCVIPQIPQGICTSFKNITHNFKLKVEDTHKI